MAVSHQTRCSRRWRGAVGSDSAQHHCRSRIYAATFPSENVFLVVGAARATRAQRKYSHASKATAHRRLLNQARTPQPDKGSIFEIVYRRSIRLGHNQPSGHRHRQCRLIWLILHRSSLRKRAQRHKQSRQKRTARIIRNCEASATGSNHPSHQPSTTQ